MNRFAKMTHFSFNNNNDVGVIEKLTYSYELLHLVLSMSFFLRSGDK